MCVCDVRVCGRGGGGTQGDDALDERDYFQIAHRRAAGKYNEEVRRGGPAQPGLSTVDRRRGRPRGYL